MAPLAVSDVARLPATVRRETHDIGSEAPCSACPIRHAAASAQVEKNDFERLLEVASECQVPRGRVLFNEGDPADAIYSLTRGTIMTYKLMADGRRQVMGFYFPGDFLGLVDDDAYAHSAEAATNAMLFRYRLSEVESLLTRYPKMEHRLAEVARHELVEAEEHALLLGRKSATEKVASFLAKLSRQAEDRGEREDLLALTMNRAAIADYLGLTTETTSRTLTALARNGLISIHGNRIHLLDRDAVREISEGESVA